MKSSLVTGPFLHVQNPSFSSVMKTSSHVFCPPSAPASHHGLWSASPDLHSTKSYQTFGSPVLTWPLLSCPSQPSDPHVVLGAKDSCLPILYLGTYMVLDQCHLEWDSAAISSYCPGNQKKTEVAKPAGHLNITTQLKPYTNKNVIFQRKKKKKVF